jgi:hypothetical protein
LHTLYTIQLFYANVNIGEIYFYTLYIILFFFDEWCFFLCFSPLVLGGENQDGFFFCHDEAGKVIKEKNSQNTHIYQLFLGGSDPFKKDIC